MNEQYLPSFTAAQTGRYSFLFHSAYSCSVHSIVNAHFHCTWKSYV